MVNFVLDEMQEMLKELAHEFARDEIRPMQNTGTLIRNIQRMQSWLHMKWVC